LYLSSLHALGRACGLRAGNPMAKISETRGVCWIGGRYGHCRLGVFYCVRCDDVDPAKDLARFTWSLAVCAFHNSLASGLPKLRKCPGTCPKVRPEHKHLEKSRGPVSRFSGGAV